MKEQNRLLTDFLDIVNGNPNDIVQQHLNMILPFWTRRNRIHSFEKSNFITECIKTAEKKGFHLHKNTHGFVEVLSFPQQYSKSRYSLLETFYEQFEDGDTFGGMNALQYLINELIDNIYQHSQFSNAYLGVERYDDIFLICISDDGITIKQSLQNVQPMITDGREAIKKALLGVSSKNEERGWGLSSTINIARCGYYAEILIVSGDGAFWSKDSQQNFFMLDKSYNGTVLEFRMKLPIGPVDIYEYL